MASSPSYDLKAIAAQCVVVETQSKPPDSGEIQEPQSPELASNETSPSSPVPSLSDAHTPG